jgi:hypothetical protein
MSERTDQADREAKAHGRTASMPVSEDSDHVIVPVNPSNKDGPPSAERGEGRAWTKENARLSHPGPTPRGASVSHVWLAHHSQRVRAIAQALLLTPTTVRSWLKRFKGAALGRVAMQTKFARAGKAALS